MANAIHLRPAMIMRIEEPYSHSPLTPGPSPARGEGGRELRVERGEAVAEGQSSSDCLTNVSVLFPNAINGMAVSWLPPRHVASGLRHARIGAQERLPRPAATRRRTAPSPSPPLSPCGRGVRGEGQGVSVWLMEKVVDRQRLLSTALTGE
jgi:hypothetical protein